MPAQAAYHQANDDRLEKDYFRVVVPNSSDCRLTRNPLERRPDLVGRAFSDPVPDLRQSCMLP
jgi:hypothetical protein